MVQVSMEMVVGVVMVHPVETAVRVEVMVAVGMVV